MGLATFLYLFLLVDVFFIGMLAVVVIQHARAHFRPAKQKPKPAELLHTQPISSDPLPAAVKEHLLQASRAQFEAAVSTSATQLHRNLDATAVQINRLVGQLGAKIIGDELQRYQNELSELRKQAETDMGEIRNEIVTHEAELKAKLAQEIEAEKQRLIQQIDTRLADAVASFLLETLQHNIDLGAQSAYLASMLEEHKADFVKEIRSED